MADDLGERTEQATPKRRQEAREEGNVAKSQDLSGAIMLVLVTLALSAAAMPMLDQARIVLQQALRGEVLGTPLNGETSWATIMYLASSAIRVAAPVLLIFWATAFLAQFMQVGWLFTSKAVRPNLGKLNPISGFKRIFGLSGLVKSAIDPVKVVIVVTVTAFAMMQYAEEIVVLPYLSPMQALGRVGWMVFDLAMRVAAVLLTLGVLDYLYQRWKHSRDLRMTRQQVKDEMKQAEGDPEVKRRRLRIQQQIAMQRISTAVPKADVIVTNPEHISIAIQYDPSRMNAPKVVAKGADFLALRIRQIALQHGIPIVERKPLARALYRHVAVNEEVPPAYYKAVAEILAYVYRLSGKAVA
jgi:flagellar biosynthetic protein FlhB